MIDVVSFFLHLLSTVFWLGLAGLFVTRSAERYPYPIYRHVIIYVSLGAAVISTIFPSLSGLCPLFTQGSYLFYAAPAILMLMGTSVLFFIIRDKPHKPSKCISILPLVLFLEAASFVVSSNLIQVAEIILLNLVCACFLKHHFNRGALRFFLIATSLFLVVTFASFYLFAKTEEHYTASQIFKVHSRLEIYQKRFTDLERNGQILVKLLSLLSSTKQASTNNGDPFHTFKLFQKITGARAVYLMDEKGSVKAASPASMVGENHALRPYFKKAISGEANAFYVRDKATGTAIAYFGRPAIKDGSIVGAYAINFDLKTTFGPSFKRDELFLMDPSGAIILGPDEWINRTLRIGSTANNPLDNKIERKALGYIPVKDPLFRKPDGSLWLLITLPLSGGNYKLGVGYDLKNSYYHLTRLGITYLSISIILILLFLKELTSREFILQLEEEISRRQKAQASERLVIAAIEQAAEAIVITDGEKRVRYCNPAFFSMTGYTREDILGKELLLCSYGDNDQLCRDAWNQVCLGVPWHGKLTAKRKDGTIYEADLSISPIKVNQTENTNYVMVIRDITKEVSLESQLHQSQKMEAIGILAGGIAHDFNNMLAAMQMSAEMLALKLDPESPTAGFVNNILKIIDRAAGIVRQLLLFSRKETTKFSTINLNNVINDLTKMIERLIGENIHLKKDLAPNLLPVWGDVGSLEQVIMNILVNARDAMPDGGTITIRTKNVTTDTEEIKKKILDSKEGHYVCLSIQDSGIGINKKVIGHIFEPFFTTKDVGKGTGLGLAVV